MQDALNTPKGPNRGAYKAELSWTLEWRKKQWQLTTPSCLYRSRGMNHNARASSETRAPVTNTRHPPLLQTWRKVCTPWNRALGRLIQKSSG